MNGRVSEVYPLPAGVVAREGDFVKLVSDDFDALVMQDTRVFKAGNSLAIRIPSAIAKRIALEDGAVVEMAVDHGMIYVRKAPSRALAELIALRRRTCTSRSLMNRSARSIGRRVCAGRRPYRVALA
jgi:antitoxin component of MazEF toxin-antitoxin module